MATASREPEDGAERPRSPVGSPVGSPPHAAQLYRAALRQALLGNMNHLQQRVHDADRAAVESEQRLELLGEEKVPTVKWATDWVQKSDEVNDRLP